jgi:hypothetical protein
VTVPPVISPSTTVKLPAKTTVWPSASTTERRVGVGAVRTP